MKTTLLLIFSFVFISIFAQKPIPAKTYLNADTLYFYVIKKGEYKIVYISEYAWSAKEWKEYKDFQKLNPKDTAYIVEEPRVIKH